MDNYFPKWRTKSLMMVGKELRWVIVSHKVVAIKEKMPTWWESFRYSLIQHHDPSFKNL